MWIKRGTQPQPEDGGREELQQAEMGGEIDTELIQEHHLVTGRCTRKHSKILPGHSHTFWSPVLLGPLVNQEGAYI